MSDRELLGCPFCGAAARMKHMHGGYTLIDCANVRGCGPTVYVREQSEAVAVAAWNRRAERGAGGGAEGDVHVTCDALGVYGSGATLEAAAQDMLATATHLRENYEGPEPLHPSVQEHLARLRRWHPPTTDRRGTGEACDEIGCPHCRPAGTGRRTR